MEYYFRLEALQNKNAKLEKIKREVEPKASTVSEELSSILNKDITYYWTSKATFGFVFTDFEWTPEPYQRLIGKGEKDLFEKIKDDFSYVVLSKVLDRNFKAGKLNDKKFVIINLNNFKDFLSIIRNRKNTVRLFLYKFENKNQEELVRAWLKNYAKFEEVQEEAKIANIDAMMDVINKHSIKTPSDLDKLITVSRGALSKISNSEMFKNILKEFKEKIDSNVDESVIHNFLFDNIWLIDFQYVLYTKKKKEILEVGQPDISVYKDNFGIERVAIIELKKTDQDLITTHHRGDKKPAILSGVGKSISQTIHYLEEVKTKNKTKDRVVQGIVIVGRKKEVKDMFIEKFNEYLHGIQVLTYDDIYERAETIINLFSQTPPKEPITTAKVEPSPPEQADTPTPNAQAKTP